MSNISPVTLLHAARYDVRAPYLMDGDDVCDFYTYSEAPPESAEIMPFPHADEKARYAAACWNLICRIASRLGVEPLALAESGAVEHAVHAMVEIHGGSESVCREHADAFRRGYAACRKEPE